jgi:hypothetical protein
MLLRIHRRESSGNAKVDARLLTAILLALEFLCVPPCLLSVLRVTGFSSSAASDTHWYLLVSCQLRRDSFRTTFAIHGSRHNSTGVARPFSTGK